MRHCINLVPLGPFMRIQKAVAVAVVVSCAISIFAQSKPKLTLDEFFNSVSFPALALSPESLVLQHHGWISATTAACPPELVPPPCWDVVLTPSGVETIRPLLAPSDAGKPAFNLPAARRELVAVTGVSKQGNIADVDFIWRWQPVNEVGAALYSADLHYRSTAGFRNYDDGWRVVQSVARPGQTLDEALKNAEPAP